MFGYNRSIRQTYCRHNTGLTGHNDDHLHMLELVDTTMFTLEVIMKRNKCLWASESVPRACAFTKRGP